MREESITQAHQDNFIHMGLGCRMYTDDVDSDSRTLFNGLSQFWSILTLISLNELHYQIDKKGYQNDIIPNATIYDALYGIVKDDAETIAWLNDTIVPIMTQDFVEGQIVHNEANLEVGDNWSSVTELPNNCSIEHIQGVLDDRKTKDSS